MGCQQIWVVAVITVNNPPDRIAHSILFMLLRALKEPGAIVVRLFSTLAHNVKFCAQLLRLQKCTRQLDFSALYGKIHEKRQETMQEKTEKGFKKWTQIL